jgi:dihydropteroate synthase
MSMHWRCRDTSIDLTRPIVMGILNVTPDSFSDGGRYSAVDPALMRAQRMIEEGARIIDVGGESSRPGALPVDTEEELRRVLPVIEALKDQAEVALSIDTTKLEVMRAAIEAGAVIVNDIQALRAPGAREWAAKSQAGVCLMHMQGEPRSMQDSPYYNDVVAEVGAFLMAERQRCLEAGIAAQCIVLDPGIGFGKALQHTLSLLKELPRMAQLPAPLLVGVSRKSFIGKLLGKEVDDRMYGGLGLAAWAVSAGVRIIRTHDVAATVDVLRVVSAVQQGI